MVLLCKFLYSMYLVFCYVLKHMWLCSGSEQKMEPLTTQQEMSLTYDDQNDRSTEDVDDQSNMKHDASSSPEGRTGTIEDSSSSTEIDESLSEIRVGNDNDIGDLSVQDFKNTSRDTDAMNNASIQEVSPHESTSDDKLLEPETSTRQFNLPEPENGNDSFVAYGLEDFDSSLTVGTGDLASVLKENLVSVEPTNLPAYDANPSNLSIEPQDGIPETSEQNEPIGLDVSVTSQSNTILEPQISSEDSIGTVASSSTKENLHLSTLQVLAEGISSSLEGNIISESESSKSKSQLPNAGNSFSSAGIPAPTVVSAALQVLPGKVLVPAVVDQVQGQALSALQVLKVLTFCHFLHLISLFQSYDKYICIRIYSIVAFDP